MSSTAEKPKYLNVIPENIPDTLKSRNQWVVWRGEERSGKLSKVPYCSTTKRRASVKDPSSWTDFKIAANVLENDKTFNGIGFVLTADDPFVGIDLDSCVNPNNGEIGTEAQEVVEKLESYSEISPSGTGIRIFVIAKLPEGRRKMNGIEVYDRDRYLTITGHKMPNAPRNILDKNVPFRIWYKRKFVYNSDQEIENTTPFDELHKIYQIRLRKAFKSENGLKIERLFNGDTTGYDSHSEADLALCNYLAYWISRKADQIDKVFRGSGLYRAKWDEKHYADGKTYGEKTIEKTLTAFKESKKNMSTSTSISQGDYSNLGIVTVDTLLKTEFKQQRKGLIEGGLLPQGGGMILAGESGVGKSLITLEWSIMMAMGLNFYDDRMIVTRPCRIVFFQTENSPAQVKARLQKMRDGIPFEKASTSIFVPGDRRYQLNLLQQPQREIMVNEIRKSKADIFIIDPLSSFHHCNENDNSAMRSVLDMVTKISNQTGAAAIVVHHFGKSSETRYTGHKVRGASSIKDWADTLITLERTNRKDSQDRAIVMRFDKVRNGPEPPPIYLERDQDTLLHSVTDEDLKVSPQQVVEILSEKFAGNVNRKKLLLEAIAKKCECSERTATDAVKRAKDMGLIIEEKDGRQTTVKILQ